MFVLWFCATQRIAAQEAPLLAAESGPRHLMLLLKDKPRPADTQVLFGPRAAKRRLLQGIAADSLDWPVHQEYLEQVSSLQGVRVRYASRWMNALLLEVQDSAAQSQLTQFPFVMGLEPLGPVTTEGYAAASHNEPPAALPSTEEPDELRLLREQKLLQMATRGYGLSHEPLSTLNGIKLHDLGYRGAGMLIAVLDAGFQSYLINRAFDSLRRSGRILGTWDFVAGEASVSEDDAPGANRLSVMASNLPGIMVGTAPAASYWLFRTEDVATEYPVEEHFWAVGAERADRLGADLISSSLGYTDFDDPSLDHRYTQLDGNTTMVSRAADMAAKKGMIVTNSAGNSGTDAWKYIGAPADGDSVLAVGAVDVNGSIGAFSSYGPSADGQVKPDVASVGVRAFVITANGMPAQGNGTSYANPNMAGLVACLWQAFPEFGNMEVIDALRRSSSRFNNPDDRVGYGIPNLRKAYEDLLRRRQVRQARAILKDDYIRAFPSPFDRRLNIYYTPSSTGGRPVFEMVDGSGRTVLRHQATVGVGEILTLEMPGVQTLPKGVWMLRYADGERQGVIRLVK